MTWLAALKDYVPLFQTLVWALLIVGCLIVFRKELRRLLHIVYGRLRSGSAFEIIGVFKLGEELRDLKRVEQGADEQLPRGDPGQLKTREQRIKHRHDIEKQSREVYLVHVTKPSSQPGQKFDLFIYLRRHRSTDLSTVEYAEFFLGRYWGNRIFKVENEGGSIGLSTSAYGPVLCTCRVVFTDGHEVTLDRYIDFEMARSFESYS
jgi:hypothetical protein